MKLYSMNIIETLKNHNIEFSQIGLDQFPVAIQCPSCKKTVSGNTYMTFNIEQSGYGYCSVCSETTDWKGTKELLNLENPKSKSSFLLEEEPSYKKLIGASLKPKIWTIQEILDHDFGDQEWAVEFLISKQGMSVLSGNPGDFKTWVTIHIALCVSRGIPVFGKFKTIQGSVLVIDEEDHLQLLKKRLELLNAQDSDNIHYISQSGIKMDNMDTLNMILEIVKEKQIKLVILDSLVRMHGQDENDAKSMARVFANLQKILVSGTSILFTHHHRKQQAHEKTSGQSMRGSSDILAAVDCHIAIEKSKDDKERLIIRQMKSRQAEPLPSFEINIVKGELGPSNFEYVGDYDEKKIRTNEAVAAIQLALEEKMLSRPEIHDLLREDFGKSAIDNAIKAAEEEKSIERVPKQETPIEDRKKAYYRIPIKNINSDDLPVS